LGNIKRNNSRPEWHIQQDLIKFLTARGWLVEHTHGSVYQTGFPDLYLFHARWRERWVDCKVAGKYSFTNAQKIKWPEWERHGVGIWILTAASESEYRKLFGPPNWRDFWKQSWGCLPNLDDLLEEICREHHDRQSDLDSERPS
jgi:hypothetical protein